MLLGTHPNSEALVQAVVAINRFGTDTDAELEVVKKAGCSDSVCRSCVCLSDICISVRL